MSFWELEGETAKLNALIWINSDEVKSHEDLLEKAAHMIHDGMR